jgi:hypothetical protein
MRNIFPQRRDDELSNKIQHAAAKHPAQANPKVPQH